MISMFICGVEQESELKFKIAKEIDAVWRQKCQGFILDSFTL